MKKKLFLVVLTLVTVFFAVSVAAYGVDRLEGGFAGTTDQGHDTVVYNFLKHFSYEQYYYSYTFCWTSNNNSFVDGVNFAIFGGHGNQYLIANIDGNVDLSSAGNTSNGGYGLNADFVAFESCSVVPSPIERSDWWWGWNQSGTIFRGLHQVLGFHTSSYQSTDELVTDYFGTKIQQNYPVWQSWFEAIDVKGLSSEYGSAVMHPDHQNDTYGNPGSDPASYPYYQIWYQY